MSRMGTTSVYVDLDKAEEIGKKGFTVSQVVQTAMNLVLSDDFEDINVELRLKDLNDHIEKVKVEIAECEVKLELKRTLLERFTEQKETIENEWEAAKDTVVLAKHVRSLNQVIIASGYDVEVVRETAHELLEKIVEVNPQFDLDRHVKRFKDIMSF